MGRDMFVTYFNPLFSTGVTTITLTMRPLLFGRIFTPKRRRKMKIVKKFFYFFIPKLYFTVDSI